jgi:hypothetical protein
VPQPALGRQTRDRLHGVYLDKEQALVDAARNAVQSCHDAGLDVFGFHNNDSTAAPQS